MITPAPKRSLIVFHELPLFNKAQIREMQIHCWLEMEKIGRELENYGLSFADLAKGFDQTEQEFKESMVKSLQQEWIFRFAKTYRQFHWETIHAMPDEVAPPVKN